jgi:hypothetical protein
MTQIAGHVTNPPRSDARYADGSAMQSIRHSPQPCGLTVPTHRPSAYTPSYWFPGTFLGHLKVATQTNRLLEHLVMGLTMTVLGFEPSRIGNTFEQ